MNRNLIPPLEFAAQSVAMWESDWFLLSAGDFATRQFNSMTISWGSLGVLWGKPMAMVFVRPQRHTRSFIDACDTFTICQFPQVHHDVLQILGSKSGRDMDKVNLSGFTPQAATTVAAPVYQEASLAIECRKVYFDDLKPGHFLADYIAPLYANDYHRMYFGEIVAITRTEEFRRK